MLVQVYSTGSYDSWQDATDAGAVYEANIKELDDIVPEGLDNVKITDSIIRRLIGLAEDCMGNNDDMVIRVLTPRDISRTSPKPKNRR